MSKPAKIKVTNRKTGKSIVAFKVAEGGPETIVRSSPYRVIDIKGDFEKAQRGL